MTPDPNTPGKDGLARRLARVAAHGAAQSLATFAARVRAGAARAWARRPSPGRTGAILFAAGSALLGAHGILFQARLPARLPSRLDWAAARIVLERDARPGDAVAVAPVWAERAREVVPASLPVLARAGRGEDLPGVRRVWLLSLPAAPGYTWQAELELIARAVRSSTAQRLGALEVTRHDLAAPTLPLAFLPDRLAQAEVTLGGVPCAADGEAFSCAGSPPIRVQRTVREVDGVPRPCLSAAIESPPGAALALRFPGVPVGHAVRGHAGAAGRGRALGAPLRIAVRVDDEEAGAAEVSGAGFAPFELDTGRLAGGFHDVTLVLTSPGAPGALCLDAETLP